MTETWTVFVNQKQPLIYRLYDTITGLSYISRISKISPRQLIQNLPIQIWNQIKALQKGKHPAKQLQRIYESDPDRIQTEVLEIADPKEVGDREAHWRTVYKHDGGNSKISHIPLTAREIRQMRDMGGLTNKGYVQLILKFKNPWLDKPVKIDPLEIACEWDIAESSVYEAIAKLKEEGVIKILSSEMTIQWVSDDIQAAPPPKSPPPKPKSRDSEVSESILESQNQFWDVRMHSEMSENQAPKAPSSKGSESSQTYSKFLQTLSKEDRESFKKFCDRKIGELTFKVHSKTAWLDKHWSEYWEESNRAANTSVVKEKISAAKKNPIVQAAIASGEIALDRYHSGGEFVTGVKSLTTPKWWASVEDWLESQTKQSAIAQT